MGDVKLTAPRLRIVLDDDTVHEVQTTNADLVRFDKTRAGQRWPTMQDAPFLWMTFIGWAALRRTHTIPADLTYETFESSTLDVAAIDEDGNDDAAGAGVSSFPTRPEVEPG